MTKTELKQLIRECLVEAAEDDVTVKDVPKDDEVDIKKLTDIEVDGINKNDWPDFVDAYVSAAMIDGVELTHEQLDWVNGNYPELAKETLAMSFKFTLGG